MSTKLTHVLLIGVGLFSSTWVVAAVKEYDLTIAEQTVNITGKPLKRITVNGKFVAPLLEFEEGDDAIIRVHNKLKKQDSSIHWHGLILPGIMDGVPGFNQFDGIAPNKTYEYKFKVRQNGTYWYHSHSKGQEQEGLYGPLVIYPKNRTPLTVAEKTDKDYVVLLSDFHDSTSDKIMNNLKKEADYYQNRRETVFDVFKQIKKDGLKATWQDRSMWNQMRMLKTDMSDVTKYTFLMNGKTPEQNWTGNFKTGEKVRLRFINASAMSFFDVRIPNLKMTVVSADGQPVKPVPVDEFRIGTAETYDVIVEPKQSNYQIEAESIDRSGFSVGSLHDENTPPINQIKMPKSRPRSLLTMEDMGMGHDMSSMAGMNHDMSSMKGMDHDMSPMTDSSKDQSMSGMNHDMSSMKGMDHDMSSMTDSSKDQSMSGMNHDMSSMKGMDHDMSSMTDSSKDQSMSGMNHGMQMTTSNAPTQEKNGDVVYGWANASTPVGQKALQYSDLQSLKPQPDTRAPEREMEIRLGGNMERYIWTINGKKFNETEPFKVKYGERIRLKFVNDSMMAHPMHLHGMFMQLENGQDPSNMPNKHTIIVPPGKTVTTLLTADELGEWAIHCHLLYHMAAGMMNKLIVANVDSNDDDTKSIVAQPQTSHEGVNQHAHH
ncbi:MULTISPECIES: multicopper oxidase domain-containing protein [Acinetobacter]|jgi:FtsP/CotA-like multicopper oxidase with cupredoxin domain|uniref:Multicopper oxidase domain-containing protein n=2 Tax=Acinetobacter TaxID=469 RepID=A0AA42IA15_9GAMM|nr:MULTISPECIES: multicopper oxidase domain-containing protein [Acinetobacter]KYQ84881.1 copper oxidase [Acinetobacter sp. NRRL B-65365]MCH7351603.1 multicopper oxidase domain-containing protein [Acinetobacter sp. NIPH 2023]MCH7355695.1 multicopper oxidase domain-containing protein [Acinetobacter sp. NIPH 1958]MCH7359280.1 multicopper oxidase domain-containing protein [Acinetobacter sp. NIPH 2024]MDH0562363.1 multicopper oxidase domain-containing protein [Acinetobacter courvalinii]